MKNKFISRWFGAFVLFTVILLAGCRHNSGPKNSGDGEPLVFKHAQHIKVAKHQLSTVVTLVDPWREGKILHTYVLVGRKDSARVDRLPEGMLIYTSLMRNVVFTTAHCKLFEYLGCLNQIVGIADLKYILIPSIHERVRLGKVVGCGEGTAPRLEKIIELKPQALFLSPFENNGSYEKLAQLGTPIIEMTDYMEASPLGRAEWMKFYGMLFGQEKCADSLFNAVDSLYQGLKTTAQAWHIGRSILTERKTGSAWYCLGGMSMMGQMIADVSGTYVFSDDKYSGSLSLSFEKVLEKAGDSDVQAFKFNGERLMTKKDLLAGYHGYDGLKAFKMGQIYQCNGNVKSYFEETPFRPDLLLRGLIIMLHPGATALGPLRYYEKIEQ